MTRFDKSHRKEFSTKRENREEINGSLWKRGILEGTWRIGRICIEGDQTRWPSRSREHCEQWSRSTRTNIKWCNLAGVGHKQSDNGKGGWRARFEHYVENSECQDKAFALNSVGIYQALSIRRNSKIVLGPDADGKFAFFPYISTFLLLFSPYAILLSFLTLFLMNFRSSCLLLSP